MSRFDDRISRAREGDRAAFDDIVREHEVAVRALITGELGDLLKARVEVEDLVQESFLRGFQAIAQFQGATGAELRSWLLTIARRAVMERGRRLATQKADARREVPLGDLQSDSAGTPHAPVAGLESPSPTPSRVVRREERYGRLMEAIDQLSPDHRQAIVLARLQGLPVKEVARRMGRSEKATSMLLTRATEALRSLFGETESLSLPKDREPPPG